MGLFSKYSLYSNGLKCCGNRIIPRFMYAIFFLSFVGVLGSTSVESSRTRSEGDTEPRIWERAENFTMPYDSNTCRISYHTWDKYADKNFQNRSGEVNSWILRDKRSKYLEPYTLLESFLSSFTNKWVNGILMIGDSHMNDQYYSLLCLLWSVGKVEGYPRNLHRSTTNKWFQVMKFHPNFSPIIYVRWDRFGELKPDHHENQNILKALRLKPSAIVFNTGSHYNSVKFGTSWSALSNFRTNFKRGLNLICKHRSPELTFIWRTLHMHFFTKDLRSKEKSCISATIPFFGAIKAKKDFAHLLRMEKYAQRQIQLQCSRTIKAVKVLDVLKMSLQRPDAVCGKSRIGRVDCSHFCSPGVVDWWNLEMINLFTS